MPCTHHLWDDPEGMPCIREDAHETGHTFADSHGSFVADKRARDTTEADRERERE